MASFIPDNQSQWTSSSHMSVPVPQLGDPSATTTKANQLNFLNGGQKRGYEQDDAHDEGTGSFMHSHHHHHMSTDGFGNGLLQHDPLMYPSAKRMRSGSSSNLSYGGLVSAPQLGHSPDALSSSPPSSSFNHSMIAQSAEFHHPHNSSFVSYSDNQQPHGMMTSHHNEMEHGLHHNADMMMDTGDITSHDGTTHSFPHNSAFPSNLERPMGGSLQTLPPPPIPETQMHDFHPGLMRRYLNGSYY